MMASLLYLIAINFLLITTLNAHPCDQMSDDTKKPRNRNDIGKYIIVIDGNPEYYIPNEVYDISLQFNDHFSSHNSSVSKFRDFILTIEYENLPNTLEETEVIRLEDISLTKFSSTCRNTVMQTNSVPKEKIKIKWIAPPPGTGCVTIKASVYESKENWYSEDGDLTKHLCEELSENENVQPAINEECCACDEAKYELAFESVWSRNTHPKKFPEDVWITKLSDIIGTSHKLGSSFWEYNSIASDGLKEFAETGNTKLLEIEIKTTSENVRTIIMARGLSHPNLVGTTYRVFRVDKENHLVSLVSKITPSPDWIVGVSNYELCLPNCSWVESRTFNLYPWDVGTNNGIDYLTKGAPTQDNITRITSQYPDNPESPFYDENEEIKSIAKLHFTLQKLYGQKCENNLIPTIPALTGEEEQEEGAEVNGEGEEENYENHNNNPQERSVDNTDNNSAHNNIRCKLTKFSEWASCSATCGIGLTIRTRKFEHESFAGICTRYDKPKLEETKECNTGIPCISNNSEDNAEKNICVPSGDWSACSVTCGEGIQQRNRIIKDDKVSTNNNNADCSPETRVCNQRECEEFNEPSRVNGFDSENHQLPEIVSQGPDGPVINCKVSKWTKWSMCIVPEPCSEGYQFKSRHIILHPQNGGRPCPRRLQKTRKCTQMCNRKNKINYEDSAESFPTWGPGQNIGEDVVDCEMSDWSLWTPCSTNCGSGVRQRTRYIIRAPSKNGKPCPSRVENQKCPIPINCASKSILP